jgi:hypothetical protein
MFSSDKSKQKKRRSFEANVSHSSTEKPIHQEESRIRKGRSHPNLLNVPLHPPSRVQNASNETGRDKTEGVTRSGGDSTSAVAMVAETDAKSEYQNMSYTDKLSIAIQMVPNLLAGDANQALEQLLHNPAFAAELVAAGVIFAGLQATPLGPLIDAYMVTTLGVDVALKLGGFLYKSYTAHNENDLKEAAVDLKGFIEIAGLAGATKLLGMAGRALKKLSGEATVVEGQAIPRLSDEEAAKIWGAGPGKAKPDVGLSNRGHRPKPGKRSTTRGSHEKTDSQSRAGRSVSDLDKPLGGNYNRGRMRGQPRMGHPTRHRASKTDKQLQQRANGSNIDAATKFRSDSTQLRATNILKRDAIAAAQGNPAPPGSTLTIRGNRIILEGRQFNFKVGEGYYGRGSATSGALPTGKNVGDPTGPLNKGTIVLEQVGVNPATGNPIYETVTAYPSL